MQKFGIKPSFRIESVVRLYARWIREGRLRPSSAWNRERRIRFTGAPYVVTPCHNCHSQIHDLSEHYGGGYRAVHLWTLLALSLGVLGVNERTYLGPDLADAVL